MREWYGRGCGVFHGPRLSRHCLGGSEELEASRDRSPSEGGERDRSQDGGLIAISQPDRLRSKSAGSSFRTAGIRRGGGGDHTPCPWASLAPGNIDRDSDNRENRLQGLRDSFYDGVHGG